MTYTIGFGPRCQGSDAAAEHGGRRRRRVLRSAATRRRSRTVLTKIARDILVVQHVLHGARGVGQRVQPHAEPERPLRDGVPPERDLRLGRQHQEVPACGPTARSRTSRTQPAVEVTTGFFRTPRRASGATAVDGDRVDLGGAANELPLPRRARSTPTSTPALGADGGRQRSRHRATRRSRAACSDSAPRGDPARDDLINWLRGAGRHGRRRRRRRRPMRASPWATR